MILTRLCSTILISAAPAERSRRIEPCCISDATMRSSGFWRRETSPATRVRRARSDQILRAIEIPRPPILQLKSNRRRCTVRADQAEFLLEGKQNLLRTATMTGNVHMEQTGPQPMQGDAGRVIMSFAGQNQLQKVHAVDGVRLAQKAASGNKPAGKGVASGPQDFEITAPIIDFAVAQGHILEHAVTSGAAQITITQPQAAAPATAQNSAAQAASTQRTVVTAGKFDAQFAYSDGRRPHHQRSRRARRPHRQLGSRPARPRQHQRLRRRHFSSPGRHRCHHATRQRRLYRWAAARQAHASLGQLARATRPATRCSC